MTRLDTIVIGAGIAGCAAARGLTDLGYKVMVVEVRDRIGGRIHSAGEHDLGGHCGLAARSLQCQ